MPQLAQEIRRRNDGAQAPGDRIALRGILVGNPWVEPEQDNRGARRGGPLLLLGPVLLLPAPHCRCCSSQPRSALPLLITPPLLRWPL